MIKLEDIQSIIDYELSLLPQPIDELTDTLIHQEILLAELLNPFGATFKYTKQGKSLYTYNDSLNNLFFVLIEYNATRNPYMELKSGWIDINNGNKRMYEPSLPDDVTAMDSDVRTNTVAKIFQKELLPYFSNQKLTNTLKVKPISLPSYLFSIRLIKKFIPNNWSIIENKPKSIDIIKND